MSAPGPLIFFDSFREWLADATFDLNTDTFAWTAHTSAFAPNVATMSVAADLTNEVANGNGYITGGQNLTGVTWAQAAGVSKFDAADHSYTGSGAGFAIRYEVLRKVGTANGRVNPLVGYRLLDSAPADVAVAAGNTVNVQENAGGIFTLT